MEHDYDCRPHVDPMITLEEHPVEGVVSYMAVSNLRNAINDAQAILSMMNTCDDFPQWADQALAEASDRLTKIRKYVLGRKSV